MFQQYVICSKRAGGWSIITREEFTGYKASRRKAEFNFIAWFCDANDEGIFKRKYPRFASLVSWANRIGMGNAVGSPFRR